MYAETVKWIIVMVITMAGMIFYAELKKENSELNENSEVETTESKFEEAKTLIESEGFIVTEK